MLGLAIALTCLCFALLAYCVWRERQHKAEVDRWRLLFEARERHSIEERAGWREERAELLQRIQAPEQAVIAHAARERPKRRARTIAANDDAAFKARDEREEKVTDG